MADSDKRAARRVPVVLRIKLRYPDVDTFIDRFATNISRGGMFIASRKPKAVGTTVKFALTLADGTAVIEGHGSVRWVREFDEANPRRAHGMGIVFEALSDHSNDLLERIVDFRRARGLPDDDEIPLTKRARARSQPAIKTEEPPAKTAPAKGKPPKKRAKKRTMPPPIPADAMKAAPDPEPAPPEPAPEPEAPEPEAPVAASAPEPAPPTPDPTVPDEPLPTSLEEADRALAALLDLDNAAVNATITRARALASEGSDGVPADADALLSEPIPVAIASIADASAGIAALTGGEDVAARAATVVPGDDDAIPVDGGNGVSGPIELSTDELEVVGETSAATPPPSPDPDDEFAIGTPLPPPSVVDTVAAPNPYEDEDTIASDIESEADEASAPLEPPPSASEPSEFTPPDPAETELDAGALEVDEMLASGLDDLPSGQHNTGGDFDDGPTYLAPDAQAQAAEDHAVDAALDSLMEEPTAVQEAADSGDFELDIDLSDDEATAVEGGEDPEGDPNDPDKKGFFKRIFGK